MLVATLVLSNHSLETNSNICPQMDEYTNSGIITQWNITQQYKRVRHTAWINLKNKLSERSHLQNVHLPSSSSKVKTR